MPQQRSAIHWNNDVITYSIETGGTMVIHALVTMHGWYLDPTQRTETELDLLKKIMQIPGIKNIEYSKLLPRNISDRFQQYKRAVYLIESAVLNPNTIAGRRRLEREFTLLINDDI